MILVGFRTPKGQLWRSPEPVLAGRYLWFTYDRKHFFTGSPKPGWVPTDRTTSAPFAFEQLVIGEHLPDVPQQPAYRLSGGVVGVITPQHAKGSLMAWQSSSFRDRLAPPEPEPDRPRDLEDLDERGPAPRGEPDVPTSADRRRVPADPRDERGARAPASAPPRDRRLTGHSVAEFVKRAVRDRHAGDSGDDEE